MRKITREELRELLKFGLSYEAPCKIKKLGLFKYGVIRKNDGKVLCTSYKFKKYLMYKVSLVETTPDVYTYGVRSFAIRAYIGDQKVDIYEWHYTPGGR